MNANIVGTVKAKNHTKVEEDSVLFPTDPKIIPLSIPICSLVNCQNRNITSIAISGPIEFGG